MTPEERIAIPEMAISAAGIVLEANNTNAESDCKIASQILHYAFDKERGIMDAKEACG